MADLKIVESYIPIASEAPLPVPIIAFHAKNDDRVTMNEMKAWKNFTSNTFKLHVLHGDHFFLYGDQSQDKLIRDIINELQNEHETLL